MNDTAISSKQETSKYVYRKRIILKNGVHFSATIDRQDTAHGIGFGFYQDREIYRYADDEVAAILTHEVLIYKSQATWWRRVREWIADNILQVTVIWT